MKDDDNDEIRDTLDHQEGRGHGITVPNSERMESMIPGIEHLRDAKNANNLNSEKSSDAPYNFRNMDSFMHDTNESLHTLSSGQVKNAL
jgi:hypothetical protein